MTKKTAKEDKGDVLKMLKKVCTKCTPASTLVYLRNIKRLYHLTNDGEVPKTGAWLAKSALFEKHSTLPLHIRRHLSIAGVKAAKMYDVSSDKWSVHMYKDNSSYERSRGKQMKSKKESDAWPKEGYKSVRKAASEMWKRVKVLLKRDEEPNLKTLYKYQMFIILKLFSQVPFRNTFASFSVKESSGNHILQPKRGNYSLIVNQHKNVKKLGPKQVTLSRANTMALRKFLKYRKEVPEIKHDFLLSTKTGGKLSKSAMGKALHRTTLELLGKSFGSRLIRVLAATEKRDMIEKVEAFADKMLHTSKQTRQYIRK